MKIRIRFLLGLSLLLIASSVHTQAQQTWVSGVGDDTNPCTRTAPCRTFAYAITVTVPGGEISVLDPGDFGPVVITKSITINGGSALAGILAAFSNGVVVNVIGPGDPGVVILRGLSINGLGTGLNGIRYLVGTKLVIEQCNVSGFTQSDVEVSQIGPKNLVVRNTTLANGASGIHLADTTEADTLVQVTNSLIVGNTGYGVHAEGKGTISVANSLLANNGVAVRAESLATVRLSNNDIFDNGTGIGCVAGGAGTSGTVTSGTVASADNNKKAPNSPCRPNTRITVQ